ncbi:MAG: hypothetical protein CMK44_07410 [Porticoccus sp.]|jgi:hypothetical protein|nr:hypothetical protein [Porticoccus sp.]
MNNKLAGYLSLFASSGTILCCALPALLVSIGAGATLGSLISTFPQLVIISIYKTQIFFGAFIVLVVTGILQYQARILPCPLDEKKAAACARAKRLSLSIYFISVGLFIVGLTFAYLIPFLM